MRSKFNAQRQFDFRPAVSSLTDTYSRKYERISTILDSNPAILSLVHHEISLSQLSGMVARCQFSSDTVLRVLLVMSLEGLSLRDTVVRIDDSHCLRHFVRIHDGPMMDFSTICKLRNSITPETWHKVNRILGKYAVERNKITGESTRVDTTAVETDVHYPTDSSLLYDSYRVLARLLARLRKIAPAIVGNRRLHRKRAKALAQRIRRIARGDHETNAGRIEKAYEKLISMVCHLLRWSSSTTAKLRASSRFGDLAELQTLVAQVERFAALGARVVDQAQRRIFNREQVPNDEKLFSIFEEHTELLKRGKAKRDIEYGHMIQIQQVPEKFITDYRVFARKPVEHTLLPSIIKAHESLFGTAPRTLAADRGYYQGDAVQALKEKVNFVAIGRRGGRLRDDSETSREFQEAQRFRAGIEGSISYLKRFLMLGRVLTHGIPHFVATVGVTVVAHNLLVLARL